MFKSVVENLKDTVIQLYSKENKNIDEITEDLVKTLELRNIDEDNVKELKEFIETVIKKYDE